MIKETDIDGLVIVLHGPLMLAHAMVGMPRCIIPKETVCVSAALPSQSLTRAVDP